jgi:hypothetical protein
LELRLQPAQEQRTKVRIQAKQLQQQILSLMK